MSVYRLKILTPEEKIYDNEVGGVTVTCEDGTITVLAGHAPMVAMLIDGPVVVNAPHEVITGTAGRGVLKVEHNEAVIMVHSFAWIGNDLEDSKEPEADDLML